MRDHVFVLGAGFSRDAGGPLTSEFLDYSDENAAVRSLQETPEFEAVRHLANGMSADEGTIEGVLNRVSNLRFLGRGRIARFSRHSLGSA